MYRHTAMKYRVEALTTYDASDGAPESEGEEGESEATSMTQAATASGAIAAVYSTGGVLVPPHEQHVSPV